mmetsp:Transcript_27683/g.78282  ORF Transcript_27683/g.78282 Transcript_27683/m.78282 type:complete len:200 (-) Transcript_27683:457-1056(-)
MHETSAAVSGLERGISPARGRPPPCSPPLLASAHSRLDAERSRPTPAAPLTTPDSPPPGKTNRPTGASCTCQAAQYVARRARHGPSRPTPWGARSDAEVMHSLKLAWSCCQPEDRAAAAAAEKPWYAKASFRARLDKVWGSRRCSQKWASRSSCSGPTPDLASWLVSWETSSTSTTLSASGSHPLIASSSRWPSTPWAD